MATPTMPWQRVTPSRSAPDTRADFIRRSVRTIFTCNNPARMCTTFSMTWLLQSFAQGHPSRNLGLLQNSQMIMNMNLGQTARLQRRYRFAGHVVDDGSGAAGAAAAGGDPGPRPMTARELKDEARKIAGPPVFLTHGNSSAQVLRQSGFRIINGDGLECPGQSGEQKTAFLSRLHNGHYFLSLRTTNVQSGGPITHTMAMILHGTSVYFFEPGAGLFQMSRETLGDWLADFIRRCHGDLAHMILKFYHVMPQSPDALGAPGQRWV